MSYSKIKILGNIDLTNTKAEKDHDEFYILNFVSYLGDLMPTILIKGLSDDLLKELNRLKVEWNCKNWAELLAQTRRIKGTGHTKRKRT